MIPVLIDGVKKYLLTEEEVDAKISASSGGSSSEISNQVTVIKCSNNELPTGNEWIGKCILQISPNQNYRMYLKCYRDGGTGLGWLLHAEYENDL